MAEVQQDQDVPVRFEIELTSFGRGDRTHIEEVASFLWKQLHSGFGVDRVKVWFINPPEGWNGLPEKIRVPYDTTAQHGQETAIEWGDRSHG